MCVKSSVDVADQKAISIVKETPNIPSPTVYYLHIVPPGTTLEIGLHINKRHAHS